MKRTPYFFGFHFHQPAMTTQSKTSPAIHHPITLTMSESGVQLSEVDAQRAGELPPGLVVLKLPRFLAVMAARRKAPLNVVKGDFSSRTPY